MVNSYNNIALVSYKMANYTLAIQACDYAIEVDGSNDKSFYLRARARITPQSSGSTELSVARTDLQTALKHKPDNKEAKKLLQQIGKQMKVQKRTDKQTFSGLFDRGEVYDAQELDKEKELRKKSAEQDRIDSKQKDVILGKQLARHYEERGMEREKQKLEQSLNHEIKMMDKNAYLSSLDFRNPTSKMVEDAIKCGVDLKDPQTVALLEDMRNEKMTEASKSGDMKSATSNVKASSTLSNRATVGSQYASLLVGLGIACLVWWKWFQTEPIYDDSLLI